MNKLKSEDVMKTLECCINYKKFGDCEKCPARKGCSDDRKFVEKKALALLREKDALIEALTKNNADLETELSQTHDAVEEKDAEIERLTSNMNGYAFTAQTLSKEFEDYRADVNMEIADARAEAITEFAERVKASFCPDADYSGYETKSVIDKIAKEMKGEDNDTLSKGND